MFRSGTFSSMSRSIVPFPMCSCPGNMILGKFALFAHIDENELLPFLQLCFHLVPRHLSEFVSLRQRRSPENEANVDAPLPPPDETPTLRRRPVLSDELPLASRCPDHPEWLTQIAIRQLQQKCWSNLIRQFVFVHPIKLCRESTPGWQSFPAYWGKARWNALAIRRFCASSASPAICDAQVLAKAEWANPGGSVKDRAAANIVAEANRTGKLVAGKTLLDSTSGNTGIAYAMLGAAQGFPVTLLSAIQRFSRAQAHAARLRR